jgi:hypothetical protein
MFDSAGALVQPVVVLNFVYAGGGCG